VENQAGGGGGNNPTPTSPLQPPEVKNQKGESPDRSIPGSKNTPKKKKPRRSDENKVNPKKIPKERTNGDHKTRVSDGKQHTLKKKNPSSTPT